MRIFLALLPLAAAATAQWGRDINPGMGPQLLRLVEDDLARLKKDPGRLADVIRLHADERIEALKRYRDPAFEPLFLELLKHNNWKVQHRALLVLETYGGGAAALPKAWELLTHANRRLRERAAIFLIKLGKPVPGDVEPLIARERDPHVRSCLRALHLRLRGKLPVERVVSKEARETTKSGLLRTPWISGLKRRGKPVARTGKGSAKSLPAADRWVYPLLGWGQEEVDGVSLQPFANPRAGGMVHVGLDHGACLDGAGFYAAAEGVVKLIHTGSDMGTLVVVEHHLGGGQLMNAVYMHGGDTVFVKAGDRVEAGQLLATMGLGFSVENGGHYAHLHYGLYPGPFSMTHNYGYKKKAAGLWDWRDPARFLPAWVERTRPLIDELPPMGAALKRARALVGKGEFGRAFSEATKLQDAHTPGSETYVDANLVASKVRAIPKAAVERATKLKDGGYPGAAVKQLKEIAARCRNVPGVEAVKETLDGWNADPLFKKALKGEGRVAATAARSSNLSRDKARDMWQKLLRQYADTCLAPRIREWLE